MNPLQKVIKYFAMAFAVALTIMIFTGVFGIITEVSAGFSNTIITGFPLGERNTEVVSYKKEFQDAMRTVYGDVKAEVGDEIYDKLMKEVGM